jgi:LmbE family N-acetylglucosaminyl deacetylase
MDMTAIPPPDLPKLKPKIVLCVAAHADDIDWWAGGTMAAWTTAGAKVYLLILTDGSRGTSNPDITPEDLAEQRRPEQEAAAKILGFADVFFAKFTDGELEDSREVRACIVEHIRKLKPDVVVGWDPTYRYCAQHGINHPDHVAAGNATLAAFYPLSRDHLSFQELLDKGLEPHRVSTIIMINPDRPNWTPDITDQLETKIAALRAHFTQRNLVTLDEERRKADGAAIETFVRIDQPH